MQLIDEHGEYAVGERSFEHSGQGLAAMADWLLAASGADIPATSIAIEVPHALSSTP